MGRVETRKLNKKKVKVDEKVNPFDEVYKLLKILGIILVLLVVLYLVVGIFITKEIKFGKQKKESTPVTINSNIILASEVFRQKEDKYYVYFYDFANGDNEIITALGSLEDRVYKVDLGSSFNNKYVSTDSNKDAQNKDELKVNGDTIILIQDGKNTNYVMGKESILEYLNK